MAITPVVEVELSGAGSGWTAITGDVSDLSSAYALPVEQEVTQTASSLACDEYLGLSGLWDSSSRGTT